MGRANRLVTDGDAGGDFGSVIVRVVSRRLFGKPVMWGGRCSCGSVELTWVSIRIIAADLAMRQMDVVRVRENYIRIRRREKYCYVFCSSQNAPPFILLSAEGTIVSRKFCIELPLRLYQDTQYAIYLLR